MDFNDWLEGLYREDLPCDVRKAIEREQHGRLCTALLDAETDMQRWAIQHIMCNWDLVLDMLTMLAMEGVYGKIQDEQVAAFLTVKWFTDPGPGDERIKDRLVWEVFEELSAAMALFRTSVRPDEGPG